jgi:hypothetical protein
MSVDATACASRGPESAGRRRELMLYSKYRYETAHVSCRAHTEGSRRLASRRGSQAAKRRGLASDAAGIPDPISAARDASARCRSAADRARLVDEARDPALHRSLRKAGVPRRRIQRPVQPRPPHLRSGRRDDACSWRARSHPIIGAGTLHALLNGVQFLGATLHAFVERGGRVLDPDDESNISLELLFGPLLRELTSG